MASALRPSMLRQLQAASLTSKAVPAFRAQQLAARPAWTIQRAAFRTSAPRAILPPLPQKIQGGVNDPAPLNGGHPAHGSYHWTAERLVSAAILPATLTPFAAGAMNPMFDSVFIGLILIHTYIGFQSCIHDYLPKWRVPITRSVADWLNVLALFVVGWGYYEFETHDVGLTEGVRRIWKAGATAKEAGEKVVQ